MKDVSDLLQESKNNQQVPAGDGHSFSHTNSDNDEKASQLAGKMQELKQKEIEENLRQKSQQLGAGYVDLKGVPIPADILKTIPLDDVKQKRVACFYYAQHKVCRLVTPEASAEKVHNLREEYAKRFEVPVEIYLCSEKSFEALIKQYEAVPKIKEAPKGVEITEEDLHKFSAKLNSLSEVKELIENVSTTELVALIIAAGLKTDASDIHIESEVDGIKLRYRIDGVLNTACMIDKNKWQQIISRLKLLSGLKLNISDQPQDGRFSIFMQNDKVDVRVSTLPTNYGESVVMRLLVSKVASLELESLGLTQRNLNMLKGQIERPNGMIITTGPTGSGKTTTLYAVLNRLNDSETKIITIEDPIEYELKGVNQSQIDAEANYTFAKGLRSIVRQDPDVVLVGEMRDLETVEIALNAALTGHLVLSTLHTNDAAGAVPRFLAMGAKPYLLAPALNLVIAQRLVRKLCENCKEQVELKSEVKEKIKQEVQQVGSEEGIDLESAVFYKAKGCEECNHLGFKGRLGVFEMFEMTPEIEKNILSNQVSEYQIREMAKQAGMVTMLQDALLKVARGVTSLDEIYRVIE